MFFSFHPYHFKKCFNSSKIYFTSRNRKWKIYLYSYCAETWRLTITKFPYVIMLSDERSFSTLHLLINGKPDRESVSKFSLSILPILASKVNEILTINQYINWISAQRHIQNFFENKKGKRLTESCVNDITVTKNTKQLSKEKNKQFYIQNFPRLKLLS